MEVVQEISIKKGLEARYTEILSPAAMEFLLQLHRRFNAKRKVLLELREKKQQDIENGKEPNFLAETAEIRNGDWKVGPIPEDLLDRRVEITGPVDRKMIINALNSGANVFMADFEDSNSPSWENVMDGQINLRDAINKSIHFENPKTGKQYKLNEQTATLMVRPRGWHLEEKHLEVDGEPMSGSLVDFGLFFFHNASQLIEMGSGPYFYLPKLESHLGARLWNEVFEFAQEYGGIQKGTIKATVLIETILGAFEMDEILYELRDHSAGLNCGRWDYIFSFIKKLKSQPDFLMPDRAQVGMTTHFMRSYSQLVIQTCHKRGIHAMGGMAAQIPIKGDEAANAAAMEKVRKDKLREVQDGHDGTWVAHPAMVKLAKEVFDEYMPGKNQIAKERAPLQFSAKDLLKVPEGSITEGGLRQNINVGILYIESWLMGRGAAAIYNLMEDAATAEISRTQVWQWLHRSAKLEDGRRVDAELYEKIKVEEIEKIKAYVGTARYESGKFPKAIELFDELVLKEEYEEFLTLNAYELI